MITETAAAQFRFHLADVKTVLRSKTVWVNFIQGIFVMTPINALSVFFVTWLVDDRGFSEADAPLILGGVVISLALGSLAGGLVADWADERWPRYGRIAVSQVSILLALPAIWYLLTGAYEVTAIIVSAVWAAFFLDWTRRGVKQPLVQNVIRPEQRSTAMALTEFFQGAVASVIIILFGMFADRFGLTQTLLILACVFWVVALFVTIPYYFVYPPEAQRLREAMQERREIIEGGTP